VFCRECAVQNLLAQRKEIQRLEKEEGRKRGEAEQVERDKEVEERERAVRDFEAGRGGRRGVSGGEEEEGRKRKRKEGFELDEGEMRRGVLEERKRVRSEIDEEKVCPPLNKNYIPNPTKKNAS
jgi:nitric oxide synthase-interacting protein